MDIIKLAQQGAAGDDVGEDEALEASPDELLLELMDLVHLAFPQALSAMTISFVPNEDGKRPALSDLDGKAAASAPTRPDLGHPDSEVLDYINHLLGELAEATFRQGGVKVLRGRIVVTTNQHGGRDVALIDDAADVEGGETVMTRVFDKSELRWLFFTPELYDALNESEPAETAAAAVVDSLLKGMRRFDIDMQRGAITFSQRPRDDEAASAVDVEADTMSKATFRFELLGSWMAETRRFMWGWANTQVDARRTRKVDEVRAASTGEGLRAFSDPLFGGPEQLFVRLTRHVASRIGALGVYRAPFAGRNGKGTMFLALYASDD